MNDLWVVLVSNQVADAIRKDIESGLFTQATNTSNLLKSFQENLSNLCLNNGGKLHVFLPDCMAIQCNQSIAENMPKIVADFNDQVGHSISCGIGMNFEEASRAAKQSEQTGEIVLFESNSINKSEPIPPNLFDYHDQSTANNRQTPTYDEQVVPAPDYKTFLKLAQIQIQSMIQQLGGDAQEQAQQQIAQMQQEAQKQQQQPRDLAEALHGEQIPNRNPYAGEQQQASAEDKQEKPVEKEEESESEDESDEVHQKLGNALLHIKEQIPQLMDLAEKNPDAFKQSMTLVQKLLSLTKKSKKQVEKSEIEDMTEELNKRMKALPVGTLKNRKKKVLVNGKAVWRSVASGMVQDLKGEPISVKSSNLSAEKGKQAGEK